jgi:hypothetical protein
VFVAIVVAMVAPAAMLAVVMSPLLMTSAAIAVAIMFMRQCPAR